MKIGPFLILKAADYPLFKWANILARELTLNDIELILAGKMHLRGNPRRRIISEPPEEAKP